MFVCQLMEVLQGVLGDQFLGIYSITFSPGSVRVNSVVRLSSPPSDSDISNVTVGLTDTFSRNGLVIDQISSKEKKGNAPSVDCRYSDISWRLITTVTKKTQEHKLPVKQLGTQLLFEGSCPLCRYATMSDRHRPTINERLLFVLLFMTCLLYTSPSPRD